MIVLDRLTKSFGAKQVLRGVTLEVPDGRNTVMIGASGSGKSVTLKLIVGLIEPDAGAVVVDGEPRLSCLTLALECAGRSVETIEGLARGPELHPLQAAFADLGGSQCGYCTPGVIMTAKALLDRNPSPTRQEIKEATAGNLCRCTGYQQITDAVEDAAAKLREEAK